MTVDGAATLPLLMVSGLSDAHTDTLHRIVSLVLDRVDSPELTEDKVVLYLNQGILEIVAKLAKKRIYLPSLVTSGEVETLRGVDAVPMPADYHINLHEAFDLTAERRINVKPWTKLQRDRGPGPIRHGMLCGVAVYGRQLRYWMVPDTPRRIAIQYHRLPAPFVATTDKAFDIPVELSTRVLVDYAAGEAFANLEQETGDPRVQTNDCRARVEEALGILALEIGPWPAEAAPINDVMGWGCAW